MIVALTRLTAVFVLIVMMAYTLRHLIFALHRMFGARKMDYSDLAGFYLPSISVLIPMHNEEKVAADVLEALLKSDYPRGPGQFEIISINDMSSDGTGKILDEYAARFPCIKPLHRTLGGRGKPDALRAAMDLALGEVLVLFDADYLPGRSLLKFLASPFADPEVGAVMGRVIPENSRDCLLTRLMDLERAGGYQVNQQARFNLGLIPQYGGTAGAVRKSALIQVGGWSEDCLTEDTDLTMRLAIEGWKIAYVNRAECYEEAPATWRVRQKQIERWAMGHTDCLHRHLLSLLRTPRLGFFEKLDGALLLFVYWAAPLTILGWLACAVLFFSGESFLPAATSFFLASTCYNSLGNFASFFEIGNSVILDGADRRVRLLPLNVANFVFSTATVSLAIAKYYFGRIAGRRESWNKTARYRADKGDKTMIADLKLLRARGAPPSITIRSETTPSDRNSR